MTWAMTDLTPLVTFYQATTNKSKLLVFLLFSLPLKNLYLFWLRFIFNLLFGYALRPGYMLSAELWGPEYYYTSCALFTPHCVFVQYYIPLIICQSTLTHEETKKLWFITSFINYTVLNLQIKENSICVFIYSIYVSLSCWQNSQSTVGGQGTSETWLIWCSVKHPSCLHQTYGRICN